jgi:hypothetical protein
VITTLAEASTGNVRIGNVTDVLPCGTVTNAGICATNPLSSSVTAAPPMGAGSPMETVPDAVFPPVIVPGVTWIEIGGLIVSVTIMDALPEDAVIVTCRLLITALVTTLNVADD